MTARTSRASIALALAAGTALAAQAIPAGGGLTDVDGVRVGHHVMRGRPTGCTVVIVDGDGAVGGVSQRGGAPGTRETDLLDPLNMVERVNAVVLAGGSAFGLDAAQGAMRYLDERGTGFRTGAGVVPIVPAAILFDLGFGGDAKIRPDADCGYQAAASAAAGPVAEGNVGAGSGATVGKMGGTGAAGRRQPMKGGLGSSSIRRSDGLVVAAVAAVNAAGDVIDPRSGQVVAGTRNPDGTLADMRMLLRAGETSPPRPGQNTTIAVVATNARLTKAEANRVALMADDGLARAIYPSHTTGDGDTVFVLATGRWSGQSSPTTVGALAADALAEAVVRAVVQAQTLAGVTAARDAGTIPPRFR